MAGVLHPRLASASAPPLVTGPTTEAGWIALALEWCPAGEAIELHAEFCSVRPCSCVCRVLRKPMAS